MSTFTLSGNIVDVIHKKIFPGTVKVENGMITSITEKEADPNDRMILPGFIDAHIHIESSMMVFSEFARLAVVHGTVATISDPHEIGNVLGLEGVRYMIDNARQVPFHFYFGAPSCVPATTFETAGATLGPDDIRTLLSEDGLRYLSEMMNYPGVLHSDPVVMEKIRIAKELGKPVDGHAPGLRGEEARKYIAAGISTDHECFTLEEALDKVKWGQKIIIREGSAAKNFEALHSLIKTHPDFVMFCSDDKHPHELVEGHINLLVRRAIIENGYDTMDVLRCACLNPVNHYQLDVGLLRPGDSADFIVVDNLRELTILQTYVKGQLVAEKGKTFIPSIKVDAFNHFHSWQTTPQDFSFKATGTKVNVIEALDGKLITGALKLPAKIENDEIVADLERDVLKLVVINRYHRARPAIGFIHNFGFTHGAIASTIAHDSHNIIAVGTSDEEISQCVNALMNNQGGIAVVNKEHTHTLPLPVAGLMSNEDGYQIAERYATIDRQAKELGTKLSAPFMTLSFMALLVIPALKLSDKGLFDGTTFTFTPVCSD